MGDAEWCTAHPQYQPLWQTVLETTLLVFILLSYVPQYISIVSHGTVCISSRFILFHALSSALTAALRIHNHLFYNSFNCVDGGPYTGWKAYSSLLGYIQAIGQLVAAIVLIALYANYRTRSTPDRPVEYPEPGIPSTTLRVVIGTTIAVVLPVSLAFLWFNQHPSLDEDTPQGMANFMLVYIFGLGAWNLVLIPANVAMLALQFLYQIWTIRELQSRGDLSLPSLFMQSAAFILLSVAQTVRSWSSIEWPDHSAWSSVGRFIEMVLVFYGSINTHVAYFLTGLGFFVLALLCSINGGGEAVGRIRLS